MYSVIVNNQFKPSHTTKVAILLEKNWTLKQTSIIGGTMVLDVHDIVNVGFAHSDEARGPKPAATALNPLNQHSLMFSRVFVNKLFQYSLEHSLQSWNLVVLMVRTNFSPNPTLIQP